MDRTPRRRGWRLLAVGLAALAPATLAACGGGDDTAAEAGEGTIYSYTIPEGAGERIDAGEIVEVMPQSLVLYVGDAIEIVNQDDRGHNVGAWFVGAGETLHQDFNSPGLFEGVCTVNPSGELVLLVRERDA